MLRLNFLIEQPDQNGDVVFTKGKSYLVSKEDEVYYYVYSNKKNTPPWRFPKFDEGQMFKLIK